MSDQKLTFEMLQNMDLPPIIAYSAPVLFSLVAIEWFISQRQNKNLYDGKDTLAAAAVGVGNLFVTAFVKVITFGAILFVYNLAPWRIPATWWSFPLCLIALDFCRYWAHRISHEQRMWWATHITHHSSVKYNFSVSFRLGWTQFIKIIFFLPVAFLGFHPLVFFICHQIEVLYQFWIHTEYIKKLPRPIEYIFTTPSHHRVHHATNAKYIDKNYGSTFIIWDRMFGTFQPEEEQPIYGITKPVNSYNPIYLVFHEWIDIFKDLKRCKNAKQVWQVLFYPPGYDVFGDQKQAEPPHQLDQKPVPVAVREPMDEQKRERRSA